MVTSKKPSRRLILVLLIVFPDVRKIKGFRLIVTIVMVIVSIETRLHKQSIIK